MTNPAIGNTLGRPQARDSRITLHLGPKDVRATDHVKTSGRVFAGNT